MKSPQISWISRHDPPEAFPDIESAFEVPDGLLAAGGDLSPERLLYAYRNGIFPWYDEGQPILWWSPNPRCVLPPDKFHLSRRLQRTFQKSAFEIRFNSAFADVIGACAESRIGQDGTWITADMMTAYNRTCTGWAGRTALKYLATANLSAECTASPAAECFLVNRCSARASNASKAAMLALCRILLAHIAIRIARLPGGIATSAEPRRPLDSEKRICRKHLQMPVQRPP